MAPKVILLADYHDDSRIILSTILQYGGFAVLEARNGAEALEMVPKHMPDAVITELTLPVIDGCEVLGRLKRHPLTGHIPVLIITADTRPEVRRRAVEEHCDAFVLKPCVPHALLESVRGVLERSISPAPI
jgi:two-component system, cell cycle response regulator DivK